MISEVALGQVGIALGLEVSRLARNNADWYRLLDLGHTGHGFWHLGARPSETCTLKENNLALPGEWIGHGKASELFTQQPAAEQRRLLQVVVEKSAWRDGMFTQERSSKAAHCRRKRAPAFIDQYAGNLRQYRTGYSSTHISAEADRLQNRALPFQQESLL